MFNGTIYVAAPKDLTSGGPELCHQFVFVLGLMGYDAALCYYDDWGRFVQADTPEVYTKYKVKSEWRSEMIGLWQNVLVVPETTYSILEQCDLNCKKVFWWMSVNNFMKSQNTSVDDINMRDKRYNLLRDRRLLHLTQSEYARNYVEKIIGVDSANIMPLSDYISNTFLAQQEIPADLKQDWVAFNPRKGFDILEPIIRSHPEVKWVPIIDMPPEKVSAVLKYAKVYVDFGEHPGKDRIPREAAISGACVITNRKGSASYIQDVPILDKYKFENPQKQQEEIIILIKEIFENYIEKSHDFGNYRIQIRSEQEKFVEQTKDFMDYLERQ